MTTNVLILCTESTRQAIGERMQKLAKVQFDALSDMQLRVVLEAL